VVQVNLHLAESALHQMPEGVEVFGFVLLAGKEKRVSRRSSVGVSKFAERSGIFLDPTSNSFRPPRARRATPERLVVIAHRDQEMHRASGRVGPEAANSVARVTRKPAVDVAVGNDGHSRLIPQLSMSTVPKTRTGASCSTARSTLPFFDFDARSVTTTPSAHALATSASALSSTAAASTTT